MGKPKVQAIKKMPNGKIAVLWSGKKKFRIINDEKISQYLVYLMVNGEV